MSFLWLRRVKSSFSKSIRMSLVEMLVLLKSLVSVILPLVLSCNEVRAMASKCVIIEI